MGNKSKFSKAKKNILKALSNVQPHIYTANVLKKLLNNGRKRWELPQSTTLRKFTNALEEEDIIFRAMLEIGGVSYDFYFLPESPAFYILNQLLTGSYISHSTALKLWGLAGDANDNRIFLTKEQHASEFKGSRGMLVQSGIDSAFSKPQRQSNTTADWIDDQQVVLLKGKFSDELGVGECDINKKESIFITDLERTLIDCIVRPAYGLGSSQMLEAFRLAREKNKISITKLLDYLDKLDYIYPYHQVIGYYLEKAGNYSMEEVNAFQIKNFEFDFYLDYGLVNPKYNEKWRLYHPNLS